MRPVSLIAGELWQLAAAAARSNDGASRRHRARVLVRRRAAARRRRRPERYSSSRNAVEVAQLVVGQPVLQHRRVGLHPMRVLQVAEEPVAPHLVADAASAPGPIVPPRPLTAWQLTQRSSPKSAGRSRCRPSSSRRRCCRAAPAPAARGGRRWRPADLVGAQAEVAHLRVRQVALRILQPARQPVGPDLVAEAVERRAAEASSPRSPGCRGS